MPKPSSNDYKVLNDGTIELIGGPYAGICYRYGGVNFYPDYMAESLSVAFECFIVDGGAPEDLGEFNDYVGDILMELVDAQLKEGTLIYRSTGEGELDALRVENHIHPSLL